MTSLVKDLSDGVRLIQLMVRVHTRTSFLQCISHKLVRKSWVCTLKNSSEHANLALTGDTSLGRYNKNPRMRVQKAENVNKALEFITSRGVKLTNIGPEGVFLVFTCGIDGL